MVPATTWWYISNNGGTAGTTVVQQQYVVATTRLTVARDAHIQHRREIFRQVLSVEMSIAPILTSGL